VEKITNTKKPKIKTFFFFNLLVLFNAKTKKKRIEIIFLTVNICFFKFFL